MVLLTDGNPTNDGKVSSPPFYGGNNFSSIRGSDEERVVKIREEVARHRARLVNAWKRFNLFRRCQLNGVLIRKRDEEPSRAKPVPEGELGFAFMKALIEAGNGQFEVYYTEDYEGK